MAYRKGKKKSITRDTKHILFYLMIMMQKHQHQAPCTPWKVSSLSLQPPELILSNFWCSLWAAVTFVYGHMIPFHQSIYMHMHILFHFNYIIKHFIYSSEAFSWHMQSFELLGWYLQCKEQPSKLQFGECAGTTAFQSVPDFDI